MIPTVMAAGFVAEVVAWRVVASRRIGVWVAMSLTLGAAGVVALVVRRPALSPSVSWPVAAGVGVGAGLVLYLATRAFVFVVGSWEAFRRHAVEMYARRAGLSLPVALVLAAGIVAAGEELFWRGLFQARLAGAAGKAGGASLAWAAYVAANLPSGNLAIVAGAVVGGAAWGALALWTGGVLASLLCHGVWTALMLAFPVVRTVGARR